MSAVPKYVPVTAGVAVAAALFLWMYLATAPLANSVEGGAFGESPAALTREADLFAYEWRHGQAGWPLYVPGFFAAAFAVAPLVRRRPPEIAGVLGVGIAAGWIIAWACAEAGERVVAGAFAAREGLALTGPLAGMHPLAAYPAAATLIAWCLVVVGYGKAVRTREFRWLALAGALYAGVAGIRGAFAFGELSGVWSARAAEGDAVAVWSAVAAVLAGVVLTRYFAADGKRGAGALQQAAMAAPTA